MTSPDRPRAAWDFLAKRWFLIGLVVLIPGGLLLGSRMDAAQVASLVEAVGPHAGTALVALVLFLMSVTLDGGRLRAALARPAPVMWCVAISFGLLPLGAWMLSLVQLTRDFQVGLVIAGSVPCTMAAASVWTRKAGGNDAVSLLVTVLTNGLCFLVTPFWLALIPAVGSNGASVQLDIGDMMRRLIVSALLPIAAGQALRLAPACARAADRFKTPLGVIAQSCVLLIIFWTAVRAGPRLGDGAAATGGVPAVILVWGSCIALHVAAMFVAVSGGRRLRFDRADVVAAAFAASQKTLPIGVLIATDPALFGNRGVPFAVFPMLMYHASQLFIDTFVADRFASRAPSAE